MIKKRISILFLATVMSISISSIFNSKTAQAKYYSATGKVSLYLGQGKIGYDGTVITGSDCATNLSTDNPPAGTPIYVTDLSNGTKGTFYKYDVGNFPSGVILDLTYNGFVVKFGYLGGDGYFHGTYYHY